MAWANIAILGIGGALLAIPIILHFLMQPKPKQLTFPALRFLKEKQHSTRSRMRLRHLLLLLLRCLLIALVALALAGPSVASQEYGNWLTLGGIGFSGLIVAIILVAALWGTRRRSWLLISILGILFAAHLIYGGISAVRLMGNDSVKLIGDSQAPVAALVVVDTSPRMTYTYENDTRLDRAQEMGEWLLDQFPADSEVCVLATDKDRPFFSVDVSAAKKRLATLDIAYASGFIPETLNDGIKLLEKARHERKEIYVLSDLTARSWTTDNANSTLRLMEKNEGINVFVIDLGVENPQNFLLGNPQLSSEMITRASGLRISAELKRIGPAAQRTVRMQIEKPDKTLPRILDGETIVPGTFWEQKKNVDVRKDRVTSVEFQFNESLDPGVYHGKIEVVGKDGLEVDNERFFTVNVTEAFQTLIVHPDDVNPRVFESALMPNRDLASADSMFNCTVVRQRAMTNDFKDFDSILLLDPEPLPAATWKALENFVSDGGGLGVFLGHNAVKDSVAHESFLVDSAVRVLTGSLTFPWRRKDSKLFFSPDSLAHPIYEQFRTLETSIPWYNHPVHVHWGIDFDDQFEKLPTQVLMRYGNGQPAIIERQMGEGRSIVVTTPFTEPAQSRERSVIWNDLFIGRAWPNWLLLIEISEYLVQNDAESLNVWVGQTARLRNEWGVHPESYRVYTPQTGKIPSELPAPDNDVRYKFTDTPGHYRLKGKLLSDTVLRGFSANLRNEDTDLTRIEPNFLDTVLGNERYQLATEQAEIQRQQGTTRRGQEFYPLLVLMMVVILGVEILMSNRFYSTSDA